MVPNHASVMTQFIVLTEPAPEVLDLTEAPPL